MRKLIFFDIDGTLTSTKVHGKIPESTRIAIQRLEANGHFVALATGRATFRAREFQKEIGISNMVCEGGNGIVINNEVISYEPLDQELAKSIYEEAMKFDIGIAVSTSDSRVRFTPNTKFLEEAGDFHDFMDVVVKEDFDFSTTGEIRRLFLTLSLEDEKKMKSIEKIGIMRYKGDQFIIVEPDDKYKGIRKIVEYFGEDEANVVVFGDGLNDRKMFHDAPLSIAMGNAIDELKDIADYITGDSDEDGILDACEHFGWI